MIRSRINLLLEASLFEFKRNFRITIRRMWGIFYTIFIQLTFFLIIYSSFRIGNFISTKDHITLLLTIFLTLQIFCLPVFNIIICYDSFIQDPILQTLVMASQSRSRLLLSKLFGINYFVYLIFIVNFLVGSLFLIILFQDFSIVKFIPSVMIGFIFVVLFIGAFTTTLMLFVRSNVTDQVSTIILPITVFYLIPFLLVNSLSYQVFNPVIADFSPTVWIFEFIANIVFNIQFNRSILILPSLSFIMIYIGNYLFEKVEFP